MAQGDIVRKTDRVIVKDVFIEYGDGSTDEFTYGYRMNDPLTDLKGSKNPVPNRIFDFDVENPEFHSDKSGVHIPREAKDFKINPTHIKKITTTKETIYEYTACLIKLADGYEVATEIHTEVTEV